MIPINLDKLYLARVTISGSLNPNHEARLPRPRAQRSGRRETVAEFLARGGVIQRPPMGYADDRMIVLNGGD